jgi:hypothetical protein
MGYGLWVTDYRLWVVDCGVKVYNRPLSIYRFPFYIAKTYLCYALGPTWVVSFFHTVHILDLQAVDFMNALPLQHCDERASAHSLDVWRDLRRKTRGVGSR